MSIIGNILVTISPSRTLLSTNCILAPFVTLNQIVLSATPVVLLSNTVQFNVASVPSQNVALAGC